ncbi:MAG: hypothetical protein QOF83_3580 [Solirubrobacteraceae bacterium]|jgi:hypothetical protein|nr:hypothetical protein [Solirubrobacteraceae bacterium]
MFRSGRRRRLTVVLSVTALVVTVLCVMSVAGAVTVPIPPLPIIGGGDTNGLNDLAALGQGQGQAPATAPIVDRAEPPLTATALAPCGPGSKPEPGVDGRVPSGSGVDGLWCNMAEVSHQGTSGGFKTFRYVDAQGHVCAFYDTALLFPTNAINAAGPSLGVAVLNMADPAHPVQTDTLNQVPMMTPHESLNLNLARGLLAAVNGNPSTEPGLVSIYDVHQNCLHPTLDSTSLVARFGHESGFSPDGRTFYATSTALPSVTAIDVSNPKSPHPIWQGQEMAHGMTLSDNGDRAYVADPSSGDMLIMDTTQIQQRKPNPQVREISRLTWKTASIPQNAIPFTENGHPYVLEFDEYTAGTLNPQASRDTVGAGRIIDIANEAAPHIVSNLRLQVDQPAEHHAAGNDPGTQSGAQGYAAHYCNIPTRVNPKLVACSFIASGLRLFNISNLVHPREVGYFVSPTTPNTETGYSESDYAMSQPAFDVARHDIWYTDGGTGFYVLHVTNGAWPATSGAQAPSGATRGCPQARGRLSGRALGPVRLGMTSARARRAFAHSSVRRRGTTQSFCVKGGAVRVAVPSRAVLRHQSARAAKADRGRVVLALTANRHYALKGVRPGSRMATAARHLHAGHGIRIGKNTWYVVGAGSARGVLKVRRGVIGEVGIATRALTANRTAARRLLAHMI